MTTVSFNAPRKKKYLKTPTQQTKYPTLKKGNQQKNFKNNFKKQQARQEKKKRKPYSLLIHKHGPYTTGI